MNEIIEHVNALYYAGFGAGWQIVELVLGAVIVGLVIRRALYFWRHNGAWSEFTPLEYRRRLEKHGSKDRSLFR